MGRKNIAVLKASKGTARDTPYVEQEKVAHQTALTLHQTYAASGTAPAPKQVSATITPTARHHIEMPSSM